METETSSKPTEKPTEKSTEKSTEKPTEKPTNDKVPSKPSEMKTSKSNRSMTRSASNSPAHKVPIQCDTLTFDNRHVQRIKEMEKYVVEEAKKRKKDWEKDVEQMREEFLHLVPTPAGEEPTPVHAVEQVDDPQSDKSQHLITRRKGSLDVLDNKKMKTLFMEYPGSGMRYKMRFDIAGFEPASVKITADSERIAISAEKEGIKHERKLEKPKEVDQNKLKSYLTTDGILIVEAPLPPKTLRLRKSSCGSPSKNTNQGNASCGESLKTSVSQPGTPLNCASPFRREKRGVVHFHDDENSEMKRRKMTLVLDIGLSFSPKEITILIIKENRIRVKARHEERTPEKLLKHKFTKDFDLPEKIETYSLRAGLTADGKLIVRALAKGHVNGLNKMTAGELVAEEISCLMENQACNVLDLSTFPPTTPQLIANSYNGVV